MSELSLEEKIERFPVISYSRVVGWYTPKKNFNPGKVSEAKDRVNFDYEVSINHNEDTN